MKENKIRDGIALAQLDKAKRPINVSLRITDRLLPERLVDFLTVYEPSKIVGGRDNAISNTEKQLKDSLLISELISQIKLIISEISMTYEQICDANLLVDDLRATLPEEIRQQVERSAFVDHFNVIPDLKAFGQLDVRTFYSYEDARVAYDTLPCYRLKAFGIQNTRPLPGSLDLLQCRSGVDTLVEDYKKVDGWNNPEINALVDKVLATLLSTPQQKG